MITEIRDQQSTTSRNLVFKNLQAHGNTAEAGSVASSRQSKKTLTASELQKFFKINETDIASKYSKISATSTLRAKLLKQREEAEKLKADVEELKAEAKELGVEITVESDNESVRSEDKPLTPDEDIGIEASSLAPADNPSGMQLHSPSKKVIILDDES